MLAAALTGRSSAPRFHSRSDLPTVHVTASDYTGNLFLRKGNRTPSSRRPGARSAPKNDLLSEIERALKARGVSARQASIQAVGHGELIRDIRRGRTPSWDRIRALCEVLGLEFYVGPVREPASVDDRRLELALEAAERGLKTSGQTLGATDKARFVASIYDLIGKERSQASVARVLHLIEISSRAGRGRAGIDRVMRKARLDEGGE